VIHGSVNAGLRQGEDAHRIFIAVAAQRLTQDDVYRRRVGAAR